MPMVRPRLRLSQEGNRLCDHFFRTDGRASCGKHVAICYLREQSESPLQWPVPFAIRDSVPGDFEKLWRIDQLCFSPEIAYSQQELKAYINRRGALTLVAENADETSIVGFIVAHAGSTGHIITIDVVSSARRSGAGSLLLRSAEDRLRRSGSRAVELETAVDNMSALSFYKRHGYDVIGTRPRYYSNGVDALVLHKAL